jgi:hypothetical protein
MKFQISHNLELYSAYRGNSFDIKWHLLVLHVLQPLSVGQPVKTNMYTALQNENGVSCLTILENKRQLTMPYSGRNCK